MICKNCGNGSIIEGSKFCNNCGASLKFTEKDPDIQMTPQEDPEGIAYYDPYIEEVVKKGKNPTCGRTSVGLLLGAIALRVIIGLKSSGGNAITAATVTFALLPLVLLLFAGSVALAIISIVRKERGSSASIAICGLVVCILYYVFNIISI